MTADIPTYLNSCRDRIKQTLENCLPADRANPQLLEAVRYASLGSGKRIRPCLVYAGASACSAVSQGTNQTTDQVIDKAVDVDRVACAVELIHTYSLIHDDLPAMDDDNLRRGQPTCHIVYGEATAILAGDGLQALAFEQLSMIEALPPEQVITLIRHLARASGLSGMVLGQAMDLEATNKCVDISYLETMHRHKTADLIAASVVMGALSSGCTNEETLQALNNYGMAIGLAFQVMDDILDTRSDTETLGKQAGADAELNKTTYTSLLGIDEAEVMLNDLLQQSLRAVEGLGDRASHLRGIAQYIVSRNF